MLGQRYSQPTPTSLGQGVYACLRVTCHLHFWHKDRGLLRATAVTRRWSRHRIRVSTQNSGEKKIPPPLLPGFDFATFRSRESSAATNKLKGTSLPAQPSIFSTRPASRCTQDTRQKQGEDGGERGGERREGVRRGERLKWRGPPYCCRH